MYTVKIWIILMIGFGCLSTICGQGRELPRGPWQLALKVVGGKWDPEEQGSASFWELFSSTSTYSSSQPGQDRRDFTPSSGHFKSHLVEDWQNKLISVQAIKLSFFKNNKEQAYIVFDGVDKTKATWFQCDNILYSSYTDLGADNSLGQQCPGSSTEFPLTIMKNSYWRTSCPKTTAWVLVVDVDMSYSVCPEYIPYDNVTKPYFKYSKLPTVAGDLTTNLEQADSIGIFFQVWDMVFKGIEAIQPLDRNVVGLSGLYESNIVENDISDTGVRTLIHDQSSKTFKSAVVNSWEDYNIDRVKYSMIKSGQEKAYVVFNGINANSTTWFSQDSLLYSSYGSDLDDATLAVCSIDGDMYRNWQIQSVAIDGMCGDTEQSGWMLVKEPRHNGSCEWDNSRKKPYFLYNINTTPASPSLFHYADVMAVFVQGWRLVYKVTDSESVTPASSLYTMWTSVGVPNTADTGGMVLAAGSSPYKSDVIDRWDTEYIYAVKVAAYKDGSEVFHAVFDATGSSSVDWLDCELLLYTSVPGFDRNTAKSNGYTCSLAGDGGFRFFIGKSADCASVSATGVLAVVDVDSTCSDSPNLPLFLFSNTLDADLAESSTAYADTLAVFVEMDNCNTGVCKNGGTCQDIAGNFRCFCPGSYYGQTCSNLDGAWSDWAAWAPCSVTCGEGVNVRTRNCEGALGDGMCTGEDQEDRSCVSDPCRVDGGFTEWTNWLECSKTCGTGSQSRSRDCTNPVPQNGGADCTGERNETQTCNTEPCPINGGYTDWTQWGDCSQTCGTGTETRIRNCSNPAPQYGGDDCVGETEQQRDCNTFICPVDGGFTEWTNWLECTKTCGTGSQSRSRDCTNPVPQHGGADCAGKINETQTCNPEPCPINGGYTVWTQWGDCSQTCGTGSETRFRNCSNPAPQHGGDDCVGESEQHRDCNTFTCPVDGGFTEWTEWSTCIKTCGTGNQSRSRDCSNPVPQYGGMECVGDYQSFQTCNTNPCPVDGGFSGWTEWGPCTLTCGAGMQSRSRDCTNPAPQYGGRYCYGHILEYADCIIDPCPVDGNFSDWTVWGTCTRTCGIGSQSRSRDCTHPAPLYGGKSCSGDSFQERGCNSNPCPVDGGYTMWTIWDECTSSCGTGSQYRFRDCNNPIPKYGGINCTGKHLDTRACNTDPCPIDGGFASWTAWGICTQICGWGIHLRSRGCSMPAPQHGGAGCDGESVEVQNCNLGPCPINGAWSSWTEWSQCSESCGDGNQTRSRECDNPVPEHGGSECDGTRTQSSTCNDIPCPVDGEWADWSPWTTCTVSCGGGTQERTRACDGPYNGGALCTGSEIDVQDCETDTCPPVDGVLSDWSAWGSCSKTCGDGNKIRTRNCTQPQYGGEACLGQTSESVICNIPKCQVNGTWLQWTQWTLCTATCGGGLRGRTRTCSPPEYGGAECQGRESDVSVCNAEDCPAVDGGWTEWSEWDTCTQTCDTGEQSRSRTCTNPEPEWGGNGCVGSHKEFKYCNEFKCPIDGGWSIWSEWTPCLNMTNSKCDSNCTCGKGEKSRDRLCENPVPKYNGKDCDGEDSELKVCNIPCADFQCDPNNPENCKVKNGNGGDAPFPTVALLIVMATVLILQTF